MDPCIIRGASFRERSVTKLDSNAPSVQKRKKERTLDSICETSSADRPGGIFTHALSCFACSVVTAFIDSSHRRPDKMSSELLDCRVTQFSLPSKVLISATMSAPFQQQIIKKKTHTTENKSANKLEQACFDRCQFQAKLLNRFHLIVFFLQKCSNLDV